MKCQFNVYMSINKLRRCSATEKHDFDTAVFVFDTGKPMSAVVFSQPFRVTSCFLKTSKSFIKGAGYAWIGVSLCYKIH